MLTQLLPQRRDRSWLHSSCRNAELKNKLFPRQVAQSDSDMEIVCDTPLVKRAKKAADAFMASHAELSARAEVAQQEQDRAEEAAEEGKPMTSPDWEADAARRTMALDHGFASARSRLRIP